MPLGVAKYSRSGGRWVSANCPQVRTTALWLSTYNNWSPSIISRPSTSLPDYHPLSSSHPPPTIFHHQQDLHPQIWPYFHCPCSPPYPISSPWETHWSPLPSSLFIPFSWQNRLSTCFMPLNMAAEKHTMSGLTLNSCPSVLPSYHMMSSNHMSLIYFLSKIIIAFLLLPNTFSPTAVSANGLTI